MGGEWNWLDIMYEGVSKSIQTGRLE